VRSDVRRLDDVLAGRVGDHVANEPSVPWNDVAGMRDHLTHRYFDTDHAIFGATVEHDLPPLVDAVRRLRQRVESEE